jgi:hypothetical protein
VTVRIDPDVLAAVRDFGGENMSRTMEEALKLWLVANAPAKPKREARRKVPA